MVCVEDPQYTKDYHDPEKRSIANSLQIEFNDGSKSDRVTIEYPLGHRQRRQDAVPHIQAKFEKAVRGVFAPKRARAILDVCRHDQLLATPVNEFMDLMRL